MLIRNLDAFNGLFWGPWNEFDQLSRELDCLWRTFSGAPTAGGPTIGVWTNDDGALVTAPVPGVRIEDIDISVEGPTLTVKYQRPLPQAEAGQHVRHREHVFGSFARTVALPFAPDAKDIEASYSNGILEVRLPRPESQKPRRIAVKSSN